jgi:DNA (cytosine-5)-methyltransferase 1
MGRRRTPRISAIDLFCGAGGLSHGLQEAGITVVAGVDNDPSCAYPFETNIEAPFLGRDVHDITAEHLTPLWRHADVRMLAGCAPCQPFSPYRRGADTSGDEKWPLLGQFGRLVSETMPELVTMENVPRIGRAQVFTDFVGGLQELGYLVDWRSCNCLEFGLAQTRRRLVLVASLLGPIAVPKGPTALDDHKTVRDVIGDLPQLESGGKDPDDPLHRSRSLSDINLKRIRASTPGGTWEQWPKELRAPCHRRATGASFRNVYARMEWDKPAPTITTLAHNFGTGRFGHPEQDRVISLREAAVLQGFPPGYRFTAPKDPVHFNHLGRLIGNAVPPPIGRAVGESLVDHVNQRRTQLGAAA